MKILLILILLLSNLFSDKIKDKLLEIYKKDYPSLKIDKIILTKFSNQKVNGVKKIDTRLVNTKKNSGTIIINKNIYFKYKIIGIINVIKTKQSIKRNQRLSSVNSAITKIELKNFYDYPVNPNILGKVSLKNYTPKNRIIYEYNVKKEVFVKRYSQIKAITKSDNFYISISAKALQDGSKGDIIKIDINGKKRLGKIINKNVVELQ